MVAVRTVGSKIATSVTVLGMHQPLLLPPLPEEVQVFFFVLPGCVLVSPAMFYKPFKRAALLYL